jgi:hypothetical protein
MIKREDVSGITLTAWECFSIFNRLIMQEKELLSFNMDRTLLLQKLWNESPDRDREEALTDPAFIEKAIHWGVDLKQHLSGGESLYRQLHNERLHGDFDSKKEDNSLIHDHPKKYDIAVGETLYVHQMIGNCDYSGVVVEIFPANVPVSEETSKKYDYIYKDIAVCKTYHLDRIVLQRKDGSFIVFPNSPARFIVRKGVPL